MKTLVPGKTLSNTTWYGECTVCGAILSANGDELLHITPGTQRSEAFAWEKCPECKSEASACFHEENTTSGGTTKTRATAHQFASMGKITL
jgi:rubredoxin